MDREPSYYEVALTNRQVVVGFVVLLACVFTAFLAGVWIGRDGVPQAGARLADAAAAQTTREANLERLTFFGDSDPDRKRAPAAAGSASPRPGTSSRAAAAPASEAAAPPTPAVDPESERMAQTLEAEIAARRDGGAAAPTRPEPSTAAPAATPSLPGERVRRPSAGAPEPSNPIPAPSTAAPAPAASAPTRAAPENRPATPAATVPFWIQVYSSTNGERANEIARRLRRSQFQVRVLESAVGSGRTYRVRVGPYPNREDADLVAVRLRREFRYDTWVTDQG